jgi:hypothetical protein
MARLFQSLVVCGAGLTLLDCGGRRASHGADDGSVSGGGGSSATPGGTASSTSGSPTSSTTGGVNAQAGTPSSSGGLNVGGIDIGGGGGLATAGTGFGGATVDILPGAESQWVCDEANLEGCSDVPVGRPMLGFSITSPCRAETTRPKSPADCQPGTLFTCVAGNYAENLVLFNCVCMKNEPDSCACPSLRVGCTGADYQASKCGSDQALCGCAYTCILK